MVTEDTRQSAASAEDGKAFCQWERTADGGLIARWRRGCRVSPDTTLYAVGVHRAYRGTGRRHLRVPGTRARQRLTATTAVVAMYLLTGFGLFSVFVTR